MPAYHLDGRPAILVAKSVIAQSYSGWPNIRTGGLPKA
jgi:hypothetical protein